MKLLLLAASFFLTTATPLTNKNANCGSPAIAPDTSTSIVGGKDAIPFSWPWQVELGLPILGQICGGSLISPQWVMTAAHCELFGTWLPSLYRVTLGVFNKGKSEPGQQVLGISEIHIHPNYGKNKNGWDIALLKLKTPVTFTDHISPVCLPSVQKEELPAADTNVFVTGWGKTREGGIFSSSTLRQVAVPLQSTEKCRASYTDRLYEETEFCAGLDAGGKDSCQGDSGGPVVFQDPADENRWKQIGIVSWGEGCARPKFFGVYSKVAAYVDFIKQYVTDLP